MKEKKVICLILYTYFSCLRINYLKIYYFLFKEDLAQNVCGFLYIFRGGF